MSSSNTPRFIIPPDANNSPPMSPAVRRPTYPLAHSIRAKPRRIPLVLRFARGSIHSIIVVPVILHSLFTALIVYFDRYVDGRIGLPATIIPSLSIVVGLMLVFRNSTSYDRFWTGRNCLTTISTSVRNLARICLVNSRGKRSDGRSGPPDDASQHETEKIIRVLIAVLYAIKHNLRAEFNIPPASLASMPQHHQKYSRSRASSRRPSYRDYDEIHQGESASGQNGQNGQDSQQNGQSSQNVENSQNTLTENDAEYGEASMISTAKSEYVSLLPEGLMGYEDQGLGLPLQLTVLVENYIRKGFDKGWFHAPLASQMSVQVNSLVDAYGRMETIRTTPIPVAHLIHQKQVLALYACFLPITIVDDYGWWSVPIVAIVAFTLYGIEGIGVQLEDPFGYDKNDIKMDGIIEDTRRELMVLLDEWKATGEGRALGGMFE